MEGTSSSLQNEHHPQGSKLDCRPRSYLQKHLKVKVKVTQSCPTLCNPMHYRVHGILQARILEWVAFPFSRRSSQPRDQTQVSCIAGRFFTSRATRKPKNTGVGSLSLLQQIFPTQKLNWGPLPTEIPGKSCKSILPVIKHWQSQKACLNQENSRCWGEEDLSEAPFLPGPAVFHSRQLDPMWETRPGRSEQTMSQVDC